MDDGKVSNDSQEATVEILENGYCRTKLPIFVRWQLTDNKMCAKNAKKGACQGNSFCFLRTSHRGVESPQSEIFWSLAILLDGFGVPRSFCYVYK